MNEATAPLLTAVEARILACLVEKEATTPEQYPLTQNAVQLACNQKTSREPVLNLEAGEVGHALRQLEQRKLVRSQHGGRAQRYEHRFAEALGLTRQQQAVLVVLMLRGAQTQAEILSRSERLASFADADDLRHCIERLAQKQPALLVRIPRGAGQREDRYMHCLCGDVDVEALSAAAAAMRSDGGGDRASLLERIEALEARVEALERLRDPH